MEELRMVDLGDRLDLTDLTIVLDRSSSMAKLLQETVDGFNQVLLDQARVEGARVTLVTFADDVRVEYQGVPIAEAPRLSRRTYIPYGNTALYDGLWRGIASAEERLAAAGSDRPGRVVVAVLTDGEENQSREVDAPTLRKAVEERKANGWAFYFIGADQDAALAGREVAVGSAQSISFSSKAPATARAAYGVMSAAISASRLGPTRSAYAFTDEDRKKTGER